MIACDLKKIGKIRLMSKLLLGLIYGLSFRDSSYILFSTELSLKNRFDILFGGVS